MPTIFLHSGFRFFFYSNEGSPREPIHVHVMKGQGEAKFWIGPPVSLARSAGLNARNLRLLAGIVEERRHLIEKAWHDHFRD